LENFRSFVDPTELSFVATPLKGEPAFTIPSTVADRGVLPVVAVFGANASGKSNLLRAVLRFREHVVSSFRRDPDERIPAEGWRLDPMAGATVFWADFELAGVHHQYGFSFTAEAYQTEWLYRWPTRSRQVLFERDAAADEPYYFGPGLKGDKRAVADATRSNALFLSTAAQFNNEQLAGVRSGIAHGIRRAPEIQLSGHPVFAANDPLLHPVNRERVTDFLRAIDIGVAGFSGERMPVPEFPESLLSQLPPDERQELLRMIREGEQMRRVLLQRRSADGTEWTLPPHMESAGTNAMLFRLNHLLDLGESVLVADEFDASLHPDLAAVLLAQFTSAESNRHGAQLLCATHSRSLLQELRRDEVVVVDKDREGRSSLRAISDFAGIRESADLRRLHESGRLGGVPLMRTPERLLG
jgi:energy-coupling factor transporter ATP-binding protein EcfA2